MLHIPIIYKVLGTLLYLLALLMSICFGMSYWFNEGSTHLAFGIPMLIAFVAGALLQYFGRHAENCMGRRDGFLIAHLDRIQRNRHVAPNHQRLSAPRVGRLFRNHVGLHHHRSHRARQYRLLALFHIDMAQYDPLDRRYGYSVLYDSRIAQYG